MKKNSIPLHQAIIKVLPFGQNRACRALTYLLGDKVNAVVNKHKMKLDLQESIQRTMFLGKYEAIETGWFRECVNIGDIVIDVGANFGHYTTLASSLIGGGGRVFAFEPSPVANQALEQMIKNINNIILIKAAVGKANGTVELQLPTTKYLHSPSIIKSDSTFVAHKVPVIALDSFDPLTNLGQIKLIKIDVEGYEPDVLEGMKILISNKRVENIFCEFNSWWLERNSSSPQQLLECVLDSGYKIYKKTNLQNNLVGHSGAKFSLQDIWFKLI